MRWCLRLAALAVLASLVFLPPPTVWASEGGDRPETSFLKTEKKKTRERLTIEIDGTKYTPDGTVILVHRGFGSKVIGWKADSGAGRYIKRPGGFAKLLVPARQRIPFDLIKMIEECPPAAKFTVAILLANMQLLEAQQAAALGLPSQLGMLALRAYVETVKQAFYESLPEPVRACAPLTRKMATLVPGSDGRPMVELDGKRHGLDSVTMIEFDMPKTGFQIPGEAFQSIGEVGIEIPEDWPTAGDLGTPVTSATFVILPDDDKDEDEPAIGVVVKF